MMMIDLPKHVGIAVRHALASLAWPTKARLISSLAALLLGPSAVLANEYLPPPTGPYQSSVVINAGESNSAQQVYRFPPSDLIQTTPAPGGERPPVEFRQPFQPRKKLSADNFPLDAPARQAQAPRPPGVQHKALPSAEPYAADPSMNVNPWAVNPQQPQQAGPANQGVWGSPYNPNPYMYPYQYGYGNQYNNNPYNNRKNNFFSNMPSPWSVMPAQPNPAR